MNRLRRILLIVVVLLAMPWLFKDFHHTTTTVTQPTPKTIVADNEELQKPVINQERASRAMRRMPMKWQRLAWCESRNHLHANRNNTYYGLWQIHKGWFTPFNINPNTATMQQQYRVALHVYKTQGAKAWSCARTAQFR